MRINKFFLRRKISTKQRRCRWSNILTNSCINFFITLQKVLFSNVRIFESFRIQCRSNGWRWRIGNLQNYQGKSSCTSNTVLMPRKPLSGIKLDEWGKKTVALTRLSRMPFGRALNEIDLLKLILDIQNVIKFKIST